MARVRDGVDNSGMPLAYLDSAPENFIPELGLRVVSILPDRWNGWLRPHATADAFGAFLDEWRRNDPNGNWGWASEVGDTLVCSRADDEDPADEFPMVGMPPDGQAVYDFTGWTWVGGSEA